MPDTAPGESLRAAMLASAVDLDGFRAAARRLLAEGVAPQRVQWRVADDAAGELPWAEPDAAPGVPADAAPAPRVPPAFIALCADVLLHSDPQRFALLYRLLWRLVHEPALRHDALDADLSAARRLAQAVRRDIHKMRAFVRFRPLARGAGEAPLQVAWFEPQHHIVERNAPFFARRFTAMHWAILTPERSVRWDGETLAFGPGAGRADAPGADAGEALWLTYYQHIFNPARLKLAAMENEMPRRYWHNLPEAVLIAPLAARAHERRHGMIEQAPTVAARRIVAAPHSAVAIVPVDRWQALRQRAAACRDCPIGERATQTVWGEGPLGAALMLVGEQPGDREDLEGRPFVGPAGQLLDRALATLGWPRRTVYLTNAVKHFKYEPRGKRRMHKTAAQREADACAHWLEDEIDAVAPGAIVALGATAARQLLGRPVAVLRERGQWFERPDGRRVLVTLHPSALLRGEPAQMDAAFSAWVADLRQAGADARPAPHPTQSPDNEEGCDDDSGGGGAVRQRRQGEAFQSCGDG